MNLQYVSPNYHLELLSSIVQSDYEFKEKLSTAYACSIRIDGSIDRTHIDKIYVMLKVITKEGKPQLYFLGVGEQTERGAVGLMAAVKKAMLNNLGKDGYVMVMKKISSICTDGTNENSGDKGSYSKTKLVQ